ncbi:MAG TPA: tetratricopeptide repeat protein, partial [Candidatus Hydrogenedentes bacterium]|nr:tetratricopeptide repeat protein [Candidatus Hydrogenedentota bacterium]
GDARAHGNLAGALTELGRYEEALPEFEAAIRLDPRFVNAHRNLAMLHVRQGNLAQAIAHLEKTLELDPGDAVARQTLDEIARQRSAATGDGG